MKLLKRVILTGVLLTVTIFGFPQTSFKTNLKVGDKAPSLNAFKWLKNRPIPAFKQGRIYLVDFGATWCVPCAKAIPYLTDIANNYKNDVDVVGVFVMEAKKSDADVSYVEKVEEYVRKKGDAMQYTVAIDKPDATIENDWLKAANLSGIPQTFIVDRNGYIAWIGVPDEKMLTQVLDLVKSESYDINDAIAGSQIQLEPKKQLLDQRKVLFTKNNGNAEDFLYRSMISPYKDEQTKGNYDYVHSFPWILNSSGKKLAGVQQIGVSLSNLYFMAYEDTLTRIVFTRQGHLNDEYPDTIAQPYMRSWYGQYWYKPLIEVNDKSRFQVTMKSKENRFNYSLLTTEGKVSATRLQQIMQNDLNSYFGYEVVVEEQMMPCWNLIARSEAKTKLNARQSTGKFNSNATNDTLYSYTNAIMKDIWLRLVLSLSYANRSFELSPKEEAPFIDVTGISGKIDYDISQSEYKAFEEGNWDQILAFLHRLGLDLQKGKKMMKVIVIRDAKINR